MVNSISEVVKEMVGRNILVYDALARNEELTDRLLNLMVYYAEVEHKLGKVVKFYIPKILSDLASEKIYTNTENGFEIKVEYKIPRDYITDFTYVFTDNFYGSLACGDTYLIIAECLKDGKYQYLAGSC